MLHFLLLQPAKSLGHSAARVYYKSDKKYLKKIVRPVGTGEEKGTTSGRTIYLSKALEGIHHRLKHPQTVRVSLLTGYQNQCHCIEHAMVAFVNNILSRGL